VTKKSRLILTLVIALVLSGGAYAYSYTTALGTVNITEPTGDIATCETAPDQPNWESIIPEPDGAENEQLDQDNPNHSDKWHEVKDKEWCAQTFQADLTGTLTKVALFLKKDKNPGALTIEIRDCAGAEQPPGSAILASMTTSTVTSTTGQEYEFVFTSPASVTAGTHYAIVLHEPEGVGGKKDKYYWAEYKPSDIYPPGKVWRSKNSGGSWSVGGGGVHDFYFRTYVTTEAPPEICGDVPEGNLFVATPHSDYTGDLVVKVYIVNIADLIKAYQYLNMELTLEYADEDLELLTLHNGAASFTLQGCAGGTHTLSVIGGSYCLVSDDSLEWEEGWSVTPELYCEVTQR